MLFLKKKRKKRNTKSCFLDDYVLHVINKLKYNIVLPTHFKIKDGCIIMSQECELQL